MYFTVLFTTCSLFLEMPHYCIVPLCTNNSKLPEISFYHLPLHNKKLLQRWFVNIRRVNTNVSEHSGISKLLDVKGVALNIPPSLDQSGQLSEYDRVKTHQISSVRLHIERAIGRIKNYHTYIRIYTQLHAQYSKSHFYVCSIFTNFYPTLVE